MNAEVKARIARAKAILDTLDGQRSGEERARRADLKSVVSALAQYVKGHLGGFVLTDPNANPSKLMKAARKAVRGVLRARGGQLSGARTKADTALESLDQAVAAD